MHIEDLKRWHWIVISLVVGFLLAAIYSGTAVEGGGGERRTIGVGEFLWRLNQTTPGKDNKPVPMFRNIRIYPPLENKQVVTLEELVVATDAATKQRTGQYQPRQFIAEIPFALANRQPKSPTWTIQDELTQRKVPSTFVAWASPNAVYALCMGGSLLLIGIIWPTILFRMQAGGYGHAPRDPNEVDLSKVRSSKPTPTRVAPTGPTREDMDQLAAVTSQYERNVGGMALAGAAAGESKAGAAVISQAARKWEEAAPIQDQSAAEKPPEEHDYGGEFYPVDRGVKKKA